MTSIWAMDLPPFVGWEWRLCAELTSIILGNGLLSKAEGGVSQETAITATFGHQQSEVALVTPPASGRHSSRVLPSLGRRHLMTAPTE